jgi:hypothetical protein
MAQAWHRRTCMASHPMLAQARLNASADPAESQREQRNQKTSERKARGDRLLLPVLT